MENGKLRMENWAEAVRRSLSRYLGCLPGMARVVGSGGKQNSELIMENCELGIENDYK